MGGVCLVMREDQVLNVRMRRLIERVDDDRWRCINRSSLHSPLIEARVVDEQTARLWVQGEDPARRWPVDPPARPVFDRTDAPPVADRHRVMTTFKRRAKRSGPRVSEHAAPACPGAA